MIVDLNDIPNLDNCVYKITSPTGRVYIGSTKNLKDRFRCYKNTNKCTSQRRLHKSFLKHSVLSHCFEVLEYDVPYDLLYKRENYWGIFYDCLGKMGLNCIIPDIGEQKTIVGDSTKRMIRLSKLGKKLSESHKKSISNSLIGNTRTRGYKHSAETLKKLSDIKTGKRRTEEAKKNMSIAQKKIIRSKYEIDNLIKRNKSRAGIPHTEEHKRKISESQKGRIAWCFGKKLSLSHRKSLSSIVIDLHTGVYYDSVREVGFLYGKNYNVTCDRLNIISRCPNRYALA